MNIYKICCRLKRAMSTNRKIWRTKTADSPIPDRFTLLWWRREFEQKSRKTKKFLPLCSVVSPRTETRLKTVGYSTTCRPRVKASWKTVDELYGHSSTTSTSISAPEQVLILVIKCRQAKNPLEQYYLAQGGFKRTDLKLIRSRLRPRLPCRVTGTFPAVGSGRRLTCAGVRPLYPVGTSPTPPCCSPQA